MIFVGKSDRSGDVLVNPFERLLISAEALWAQRSVKLAPEPPGERCGVSGLSQPGRPLHLVAVGDSLVAGSGVDHQSEALTPLLAGLIAQTVGAPVKWETRAQLGATIRRVRYRYLPEVTGKPDYLFICAGTNDIMARRSIQEWCDDLSATLDEALTRGQKVFVCSSGQPHNSPALPKALREALGRQIDAQTEASIEICRERGVPFTNVSRAPLPEGFWATDGFHPSRIGYEFAAKMLVDSLFPQKNQ